MNNHTLELVALILEGLIIIGILITTYSRLNCRLERIETRLEPLWKRFVAERSDGPVDSV